ncbi:MAG: hypothetical protein RL681_857 [Candidatus Parcubacteria bacterium]|jgi:predicted component of type VI protein secretion system
MDSYRIAKVGVLALAQQFRAQHAHDDPVSQIAPEAIREELVALAYAAGSGFTEEEARELAVLVNDELNAGLKELRATAQRVLERLAPGRHSID